MRKNLSQITLAFLILGLCSCASYQQSTQEFRNSWDLGDEVTALSNLEKAGQSIRSGHDEELLWNMEMVTVSRANKANQLTDIHIERAKSIVEENFGGGLIDPSSKEIGEYVGHFHDRNMLEIYRTIRALESKNNSLAQSALTELKFKRQEAEEINRKRIIDIESKARERNDLKYGEFLESGEIAQNELVNEEIADKYKEFYNPMGDYLRLVLTNRGGNQFDFGTNKQNLIKTLGKNVSFLQREEKINANDSNSSTYVFLETGSSPHRIEKKYRLSLVLIYNGMPPSGVLYVPFALPQLNYRDDYDGFFTIVSGEKSTPMEVLTDMDSVVSAEFKAKLPGEIAKALIQTILAVASQAAIEEVTKDEQDDNFGVMLLATVAKVAAAEAFTQADDRSWYSLPKQILVQKVSTPQNGQLSVRAGSNSEVSFQVNPNNQTNFVYLKSIRRGNPIKIISSFGFGEGLADSALSPNSKILASNH
ncbi:MAG: hypothetical protein VXZ32_09095 [Verrucomicrobiota bacterium]|nr:hypothetical protein [Verrucomicrobiota bacterium]